MKKQSLNGAWLLEIPGSDSNEELDQLLPWHQRMRESLLFKDNTI